MTSFLTNKPQWKGAKASSMNINNINVNKYIADFDFLPWVCVGKAQQLERSER